MKFHIEMNANEMAAVNAIVAIFEEQKAPVKQKLHEYTDGYTQTIITDADGSYKMDMEVKETFTIHVASYLAQICAQAKGLIMGAVDTYRNMVKMLGIKHLEIDDKEVNLSIPCKVSVNHNGYKVSVTKYVPTTSNMEDEKKTLKENVIKKIDESYVTGSDDKNE